MKRVPLIAAIVLGVIALLLVILNSNSVQVNLLIAKFSIPMSILLVAAVALGFVLGLVLPLLRGKKPQDDA